MAYIKKEPIVEFITKGLNNPDKTKAYGYDAIEILTEIEYTPTADVVEVCRCKDCKNFEPYANGKCGICRKGRKSFFQQANDYCSDGERSDT